VIARNDGTKLSSLRNDSPASGGNERGWNDGSGDARDKEKRTASANGSPRGQIGVIDPIRMESDAEIRGFLINRQPAFFVGSSSGDFVSSCLWLSKRLGLDWRPTSPMTARPSPPSHPCRKSRSRVRRYPARCPPSKMRIAASMTSHRHLHPEPRNEQKSAAPTAKHSPQRIKESIPRPSVHPSIRPSVHKRELVLSARGMIFANNAALGSLVAHGILPGTREVLCKPVKGYAIRRIRQGGKRETRM